VQQISYQLGYAGTVSDVSASTPETITEPFHFSYSYTRKDYPTWKTDQQITVPGLPFYMPPVKDDAKYPVWLGPPLETVSDSKVELPKGHKPQVPSNVNLKYDFAEYHASYSQDQGALIAKRRLLIKLHEVPVAEFDDYRSFLKNLQDDVNRYVQTSSSAEDLHTKGYDAVRAGNYSLAIDLLKRAVEEDPKHRWAWNDLGLAYFDSLQDDLAIRAYQKQIEIDPQHPYAFNNLGRVYLRQRKYEEAIKWFKKQIEINSLDRYAHANLGTAYLGQHKYQEAVPELEQAASLTPDNPEAQMRLGEAYLKAGRVEKGAVTLEKVVEARPGPETWNDVGYELADANVNLAKALEYSQRAVDAQERDSHEANLSNLVPKDLACTQKIGMSWDTLGWVHFRLGHLDQAESYLHAAWLLSQGGVEADHLGQVYEQQKKAEKAIRMYRLALSTRDSHSGSWDETRHRLEHLTGTKEPTVPDLLRGDPQGSELSQLRSVKLKRLVPGSATAEFFLLFSPGPKVEDVKFINGSEELKSAGQMLSETNFQVSFPEGSSARLVRRVILTCSSITGCEAVLCTPDSVKSVK
jgi:tetratricopeptide (TPR) repeat protein